MKINLIWAQSSNGVIGKDGKLPWHLPEDLERFKWLTTGCPVIMGRKTWDSLPERVKPLPGRCNIVMTRRVMPELPYSDFYYHSFEGKFYFSTYSAVRAVKLAEEFCSRNYGDDTWVIGGKEIFEMFLPMADYVYVTTLHEEFDGDVTAPIVSMDEWRPVYNQTLISSTGVNYENKILKRVT